MSENSIRLLGVSASPRLKATDTAMKMALAYAAEHYGVVTDYFSVHKKIINFCIHCDYCIRKKEGCIHKDDMLDLYPKLEWANAFVLGTPVYQGQVSGQLKAVLDRCRALVARDPKIFENKVGTGIAIGGDRAGGQEQALHSMIDFYLINEMVPVGGGSFGANLGAAFWSKDQGAAGTEKDEEGLRAMRRIIDRLVKVAVRLHG